MGAIVCPPSPGFYTRPTTLEQLIDHTVGRLVDAIGIRLEHPLSARWAGPDEARARRRSSRRTGATD
jgi:4-hydroxy-3-polyprenylbenzoate decarboxylase